MLSQHDWGNRCHRNVKKFDILNSWGKTLSKQLAATSKDSKPQQCTSIYSAVCKVKTRQRCIASLICCRQCTDVFSLFSNSTQIICMWQVATKTKYCWQLNIQKLCVDYWTKICHSTAIYNSLNTNSYSTNKIIYATLTCIFAICLSYNRSMDTLKYGKFLGHHCSLHWYKMRVSHLCPDNKLIIRQACSLQNCEVLWQGYRKVQINMKRTKVSDNASSVVKVFQFPSSVYSA